MRSLTYPSWWIIASMFPAAFLFGIYFPNIGIVPVLIISLIAGSLISCLLLYLWTKNILVRIRLEDVQRRIDAAIPISGQISLLGSAAPMLSGLKDLAYMVRSVTVEFRSDRHIGIAAGVSATLGGQTIQCVAAGSGVLAYRDGSFYVHDFVLEALTFSSDPATSSAFGLLKDGMTSAASYVGTAPLLYTAFPGLLDGSALEWIKPLLSSALATALAARPVYTLSKDGLLHRMLLASLVSVGVCKGHLDAVLKPPRLF